MANKSAANPMIHIDTSQIPEHYRMELLAIMYEDIIEKRRAEMQLGEKESVDAHL